jgi:hypothetical protein
MAHSYSVAVQPLLGGVVDAIETVVAGGPCRPASSAC